MYTVEQLLALNLGPGVMASALAAGAGAAPSGGGAGSGAGAATGTAGRTGLDFPGLRTAMDRSAGGGAGGAGGVGGSSGAGEAALPAPGGGSAAAAPRMVVAPNGALLSALRRPEAPYVPAGSGVPGSTLAHVDSMGFNNDPLDFSAFSAYGEDGNTGGMTGLLAAVLSPPGPGGASVSFAVTHTVTQAVGRAAVSSAPTGQVRARAHAGAAPSSACLGCCLVGLWCGRLWAWGCGRLWWPLIALLVWVAAYPPLYSMQVTRAAARVASDGPLFAFGLPSDAGLTPIVLGTPAAVPAPGSASGRPTRKRGRADATPTGTDEPEQALLSLGAGKLL